MTPAPERLPSPAPARPPLSMGKRLAFILLTLLLATPLLELGALLIERAHRSATHETNPYIDFVNPVPVFERVTLNDRTIYRRTEYQPLVVRTTSFSGVKAPGTLRVFLLGGSAASGWPHNEEYSGYTISSLLAQKLRRLYPGRIIEVINAAGSTYASHRVKFVFDEIIEYEPDLVILYNGNNEFLENFVFHSRLLRSPWNRSALLRTVHEGLQRLSAPPRPAVDIKNYSLADQASNRVSYAFGQVSRYRRDPEQFEQVLERYRYNIGAMARECRQRGVAVMLLTVPVNLKDWIPNASAHRADLDAEQLGLWQQQFRDGVLALERGDDAVAAEALARAAAIDDEHAETHYELGRALLRMRRAEEAKTAFIKALERDAYPFREIPALDVALRDIARTENVPLVDAVAIVEARAADGIAGLDVLVDYVHLTGSSQEAIAHGVLEEMARQKLLGEPRAVQPAATRIEVPAAFDDMATDHGLISMYRQLLVMRQYDKLDDIYTRLSRVLGETLVRNPEKSDSTRHQLDMVEHIQKVIVPYRKLLRAEKLGTLAAEFTEEEARQVFNDYMLMIRVTEGMDMPWEQFAKSVPDFDFPDASAKP